MKNYMVIKPLGDIDFFGNRFGTMKNYMVIKQQETFDCSSKKTQDYAEPDIEKGKEGL